MKSYYTFHDQFLSFNNHHYNSVIKMANILKKY